MQASDFKWGNERLNRLQVVKKAGGDFIKGREYDRIGMVVFDEEAFTQCPLTIDYGVLLVIQSSLFFTMIQDLLYPFSTENSVV